MRAASEDQTIDLRLFGKNVTEAYDGCRLAFWQANRDPETDTYAYVFYAPFNDGEELPGWMKVGGTVYMMNREDSVRASGQMLESLRLYRASKGSYTALIEVLDQHVEGDNIVVDKGQMTITHDERYPFVITVKGGIICPNAQDSAQDSAKDTAWADTRENSFVVPSGLYGDAISLGQAQPFNDLSAVPTGILDAVAQNAPDCDPHNTTGNGARYAISDAMTLWEVPCSLYARSASSVYVTALNDNPAYANVLFLPGVPDHGDMEGRYELLNPVLTPSNAVVHAEDLNIERNCGSSEYYQLRAVEGEALEFFLLEYREKSECSGPERPASAFPLIFRAE
ncbi:hypothetical protein [Cohaesibacter sp. ES.047]|uniref:hypothetical protein n=1 Tax=Cohaesibacter sp. ES.047 TaxID=1798205 RepID=UPI0012FD4C40|nr:hypothetical protein [Cohaesibacter sp. ES.047]